MSLTPRRAKGGGAGKGGSARGALKGRGASNAASASGDDGRSRKSQKVVRFNTDSSTHRTQSPATSETGNGSLLHGSSGGRQKFNKRSGLIQDGSDNHIRPPGASVDYPQIYKDLKSSREQERKIAIKRGLLSDPDHPRPLSEAITPVGTCQDMCPEFERVERIIQKDVWGPEFDPSTAHLGYGKQTPDESRMVKKFRRSAAGLDEQLPSDLRPPVALQKTLNFLLYDVVENAALFAKVQNFVWDRTRAIRNDFSIQQVSKLFDVRIAIDCFERIVRFHLLSLHLMARRDRPEVSSYSHQQDMQQLDKALYSLMQYYDDNRDRYNSENEPEFRAYWIVLAIQTYDPYMEHKIHSWPQYILNDTRVKHAMDLFAAAGDVLDPRGPTKLRRKFNVAHQDWQRFWNLLTSNRTSYLMGCCAERVMNHIRRAALHSIWIACKQGAKSNVQDWTVDILADALGLDEEEDVVTFCNHFGLDFSDVHEGRPYLMFTSLQQWDGNMQGLDPQIFSKRIVEAKRGSRTFKAILQRMSIVDAQQKQLVYHEEEEQTEQAVQGSESLFVSGSDSEDESDKAIMPAHNNPFATTTTNAAANPFAKPKPNGFANPFAESSGMANPSTDNSVAQFPANAPALHSAATVNRFDPSQSSSKNPRSLDLEPGKNGNNLALAATEAVRPAQPVFGNLQAPAQFNPFAAAANPFSQQSQSEQGPPKDIGVTTARPDNPFAANKTSSTNPFLASTPIPRPGSALSPDAQSTNASTSQTPNPFQQTSSSVEARSSKSLSAAVVNSPFSVHTPSATALSGPATVLHPASESGLQSMQALAESSGLSNPFSGTRASRDNGAQRLQASPITSTFSQLPSDTPQQHFSNPLGLSIPQNDDEHQGQSLNTFAPTWVAPSNSVPDPARGPSTNSLRQSQQFLQTSHSHPSEKAAGFSLADGVSTSLSKETAKFVSGSSRTTKAPGDRLAQSMGKLSTDFFDDYQTTDFTVAQGDQDILAQLIEIYVDQIVSAASDQFTNEQLNEEADAFRLRSLATKYGRAWREVAHILRTKRAGKERRRRLREDIIARNRRRQAEEDRDVMKQFSDFKTGKGRHSVPSPQTTLSSTHIDHVIQSSLSTTQNGSSEQKFTGSGHKRAHSQPKGIRDIQTPRNPYRMSKPSSAPRMSTNPPSQSLEEARPFGSSIFGDALPPRGLKISTTQSNYFRLKAMGVQVEDEDDYRDTTSRVSAQKKRSWTDVSEFDNESVTQRSANKRHASSKESSNAPEEDGLLTRMRKVREMLDEGSEWYRTERQHEDIRRRSSSASEEFRRSWDYRPLATASTSGIVTPTMHQPYQPIRGDYSQLSTGVHSPISNMSPPRTIPKFWAKDSMFVKRQDYGKSRAQRQAEKGLQREVATRPTWETEVALERATRELHEAQEARKATHAAIKASSPGNHANSIARQHQSDYSSTEQATGPLSSNTTRSGMPESPAAERHGQQTSKLMAFNGPAFDELRDLSSTKPFTKPTPDTPMAFGFEPFANSDGQAGLGLNASASTGGTDPAQYSAADNGNTGFAVGWQTFDEANASSNTVTASFAVAQDSNDAMYQGSRIGGFEEDIGRDVVEAETASALDNENTFEHESIGHGEGSDVSDDEGEDGDAEEGDGDDEDEEEEEENYITSSRLELRQVGFSQDDAIELDSD